MNSVALQILCCLLEIISLPVLAVDMDMSMVPQNVIVLLWHEDGIVLSNLLLNPPENAVDRKTVSPDGKHIFSDHIWKILLC